MNADISLKKKSLLQKGIAWIVVLAMLVSLLPTVALPTLAAEDSGIVPVTIEPGEKVDMSFERIKEPRIVSNRCKGPNGVSSYQANTKDDDGESGKGWCMDHTKGAPGGTQQFDVIDSANALTDATTNVFFTGYGEGRDTSYYVQGLYDSIVAAATEKGAGGVDWVGSWKDVIANDEGLWKKATQLAIWMSLKTADGKRMMAIEGQKEVSGGSATQPPVVGSADAYDYILLSENTDPKAKACIEAARALYFYATYLADKGFNYANRQAAVTSQPLLPPDLQKYWDGETLTLNDIDGSGKGSIGEAGFQTEGDYYVIPWMVNSATQPSEAGYTLKVSGNFPPGTIIQGMTDAQLQALGVETENENPQWKPAAPDKKGEEVSYFPFTPTTAGEGRTDANFGSEKLGGGKQSYPCYFNVLIPKSSVTEHMEVSFTVTADVEVYNYELYVASGNNNSWQNFLVGNLYKKMSDDANVVGGGAPDPEKPNPPDVPQAQSSDSVIFKTDENGVGLAGAQIKLTNTETRAEYSRTTEQTGKLPLQWTDPTGANYCPPGTYVVEEMTPPPGYNKDTTPGPHIIELKEDGSASGVITFVNTKKPTLRVWKVDGNTGDVLAGAVFEVYKDAELLGTVTTGTEGYADFNNEDEGLTNGTYRIVEITPPPGYTLPPADQREQEIEINVDNENPNLLVGEVTFTDYALPDIVIEKYDAASNAPLDGATFDVFIDGTKIGSFTTEGGKITIDFATYGQYLDPSKDSWTLTVTETSAPDGYVMDDPVTQTVEIRKGEALAPLVFKDTKLGEFLLVKTDENGDPLPGAEFEIKIDGTNFSASKQTDENGEIHISYEEYGDYLDRGIDHWTFTITELSAPEGYLVPNNNNVWTQEMQLGQTLSALEIKNYKYPEIVVEKLDRETGEPLPNTTFEFYFDGVLKFTKNTGEDGRIVVGFEEYGAYLDQDNRDHWTVRVKEVEPPDYYNLDIQEGEGQYEIEHQLQLGQYLDTFVFKDTHYRDIKVYKRDAENGWPLAGATFRLHCVAADHPLEAGDITDRELTTDETGYVIFEDVPNGTYEITEVQPPIGYEPNAEKQTVVVTSDSDKIIEYSFENAPKTGILIRKIDSVTKQPIPGVLFRITPLSPLTKQPWEATTDSNGIINCEDLEEGSYKIEEVATVDGYVLDTEPQIVEVNDQHDSFVVTFENNQENMLTVLKIDSATGMPVPGARFVLRTAGGQIIAYLTTGPYGYATYPGLKPGSYVVEEVEAPPGFNICRVPQTFEVSDGDGKRVYELIFYDSPLSNIFIHKVDEFSHVGIPGVVFEVRKSNGEIIEEQAVTDEEGYIHIGDLEAGTYIFKEVKSAPGYVLNTEEYIVEVEEGETKTLVIENKQEGGVSVVKIDEKTGAPLEGAEFELRAVDGRLVGTQTTGRDGYARWGNVTPGWYTLTETRAPIGYAKDPTPRNIEVVEFEATSITWENAQHASITVAKRDSETYEVLPGAVFEIRTMEGQLVDTLTTDLTGTATSKQLEPGWYRVKETHAPDGYVLNEKEELVEILADTPFTLDFPNTKMRGITVHKVDAVTDEPLAGATFEVRTVDGKLVESYTTDASGTITTKALDPGYYTVVEVNAPDGYVLNEEEFKVEVEEGLASVVTVRDYPETVIQLYKTDAVTGDPLQGAEFEVLDGLGHAIEVLTTDKTGVAYSQVLEPGIYSVREIKAPTGYTLDPLLHPVVIAPGENAILHLTNAPDTALHITKIDAYTRDPLAGAEFEVRYDAGSGEYTYIGTYVTDYLGRIDTDPLTPGFYLIKETHAPEGYMLDDTEHRFFVKPGENNELVLENEALATLVVRKIDAKTGKPIPGAVFKVENADRKDLVGTKESDANGEAIFTGLTEGFYIVTEEQAPAGYTLSANPTQTVQVEYGKKNYVDFRDVENGSLVIVLQDRDTGEYLMGGQFKVTRESDQIVVYDGSTDVSGTIVVGELLPGWYHVEQVFAPDNYTMVDVEMHVEVLSGQQQKVYFKDTTASMVIEKIDKNYPNLLLDGARFQVTRDEDGIVIGEYVTGKDGLAMVEGLKPGLYTVEELVAPLGYALDAKPQKVNVLGGTAAHVTFEDSALSSITVKLVEAGTQAPVAGATVEIWRQNGELINTYVSDSTGVIQTDKLEAGYYVIKVVGIPEGYTLETTEYTVEVKNGVETTQIIEFVAEGTLKIMAVDSAGVGLPGMKATVAQAGGASVGEFTTGADGSVIVPNLEPGWYVVTETEAPEGYVLPKETSQNVEVNGNVTVTFEHGKIYGLQILTSCEQSGERVAGATYEVRTLEETLIGTYTSDAEGIAFVTLEPGWYTVKPMTVPEGYSIPDATPRKVEVKADEITTSEFVVTKMSSIRVKVVDGTTQKGIYNVRLQLKDENNVLREFYTDNEGYITIDQNVVNGKYFLEMISAPEGYIVDKTPKSISALVGKTTEITWALYKEGGQIQVVIKSADYNETLDKAAGSLLQGAVFQVMNADTYQVVAQMISDANGVAASPALPIGRYIVSQVSASEYYAPSEATQEVRIKINNDVVRVEYTNVSVNLATSIDVKSNKTVRAGNSMRVDVTNGKNGSDVRLDNFYLHIKVPTDAARITTLNSGKWNHKVNYSISYKTNMNDYKVLAQNLSSANSYEYGLSTQALALQTGEYVTDVRIEFGTVPAGFAMTSKTCFTQYVLATVYNGHKLISRVEVGGQYNAVNLSTAGIDNNFPYSQSGSAVIGEGANAGAYGGTGTPAVSGNSGQWTTATGQWTTAVTSNVKMPSSLPKTGY